MDGRLGGIAACPKSCPILLKVICACCASVVAAQVTGTMPLVALSVSLHTKIGAFD
jgi:hypothetical protein